MSWHDHNVQLALWCAQPALQGAVAFLFWRRKLQKQFPVFFSYLLAQIGIFVVVFPLFQGARSDQNFYEFYFYLYWLGTAISAFLGFKVIHEIFLDVFRPYHTLKDLGTVLFKWAGVVMLLVSVVVAFSNSSSFEHGPIVHAVTTLQRSVRMVQCGLILFLMLFSGFLGVSRKQQSFGIALGFGMFASVELVLIALSFGGFLSTRDVGLLNTVMYDVSIMIWFTYALLPAKARDVATNQFQTQRWEQSLADIQHPANSDSLIPMFEGMVERAFSRNSHLTDISDARQPVSAETPHATTVPAAAGAAASRGRG
jgi:hypothetical protein